MERTKDYRWSSAGAHYGNRTDSVLNLESGWREQFAAIDDWSAWLSNACEVEKIRILRQNVEKGLSCGSENFVQSSGKIAGRPKKTSIGQKRVTSPFVF